MIPDADTPLAWSSGAWLNPPLRALVDGDELVVAAAEGSDVWRTAAYGFVHDDGHALLRRYDPRTAVEVSFRLHFDRQFDQAGVLVRAGPERWMKVGVEFAEGAPQLGAVVTQGVSDWSVCPVPTWAGTIVTIRVSRMGDALTARARSERGPWGLVRVTPWPPDLAAEAGPFCCAPMRAGLDVRFTGWRVGPADERLPA